MTAHRLTNQHEALRARIAGLRVRESETARMIDAIDNKIDRLTAARNDRQNALEKIRSELAQIQLDRPVATDHEPRD